jgi:hypothetical protein
MTARHDWRYRPQEPSLEPVETGEDWEEEERMENGREEEEGAIAPAEQGEGLTKLIIQIVEYVKWAFAPSMSKKDATEFWNKLEALLASRPQPEAAQDARELVDRLRNGREGWLTESEEYGWGFNLSDDEAVADIERSFQARLASARDQGELKARQWHEAYDRALDDVAIAKALTILAERKGEEMRAAVIDCIPSSWLDPLLTGASAVIHKFSCPEIEALLNGVKARISAALATSAEGTTK